MARTKKKKVDDFKKVKLKVGKKLKKPSETNTSFKSGKVVLLEQLKRDAAGNERVPVTKRKLTLLDLLHHLRHYNANVRKDGVAGLKELLNDNPHLVRSNLCSLIECLGPLFTDSGSEILKTSIAVWEVMFMNVDSAHLAPYLPLLTAHLNCAMTHLNADVKRFSLKILNLLLTSHADLLRQPSSFDMISCFLNTLPHSQSAASSGATAARSLMPRTSKHELLKVVKNILSMFNVEPSKARGITDSNRDQGSNVIDCRSSSSAIMSVSLSAAEWPQDKAVVLDDYVRPLASVPNEMERSLRFINSIFPFCHALWIEVSSAEDQESVDCFSFDSAALIIMNDILCVYNSLLRRPVGQLLSVDNEGKNAECDEFRSSIRQTMTKACMDRYCSLLPCRRAPRKSGEEARLSECNLSADVCSSVNFGLCRFFAYASVILEKRFPYPVDKISDYLLYFFSGEKKRIDSQTLRCGLEVVRDLRLLMRENGRSNTSELRDHYVQLGRLIVDSLLMESGRWKTKVDILSWICHDLENSVDVQEWPKFNEFIERLPALLSPLVEETKKVSGKTGPASSSSSLVFSLLFRLTRILLLRIGNLPLASEAGRRAIESELLCLLLSNIDQYPPESRKAVLNLLYYAVPLRQEVSNCILSVIQGRQSQELETLRKLLK